MRLLYIITHIQNTEKHAAISGMCFDVTDEQEWQESSTAIKTIGLDLEKSWTCDCNMNISTLVIYKSRSISSSTGNSYGVLLTVFDPPYI